MFRRLGYRPCHPLFALLPILGAACAPQRFPLPAESAAALADAASHAHPLGRAVYEGKVYPLEQAHCQPKFRYERWQRALGQQQISTHLTYTAGPSSTLLVLQQATHLGDYTLQSFRQVHRQTGVRAAAHLSATGAVTMDRWQAKEHQTATEQCDAPAVVGPTLYGFVRIHWEHLLSRRPVPVCFVVAEQLRTFAFVLQLESHDAQRTTLRFAAESLWLRLFVAEMWLQFDSASREILNYRGRVPPVEVEANLYRPVDAEVRYSKRLAPDK